MNKNAQGFVTARTTNVEVLKIVSNRVDESIVVIPTILGYSYVLIKVSFEQFEKLYVECMKQDILIEILEYHGEEYFPVGVVLSIDEIDAIVEPLYKVYFREMHDVYFK